MNSSKTILVTGATGFIGSYLIRYLSEDHRGELRAIRRESSSMELVGEAAAKMRWYQTDILDPLGLEEALRGVDQVYHVAAMVSLDPKRKKDMIEVNQQGTANVVDACLHAGVEKLVYVSSIAVIGRPKHTVVVDEEVPWHLNQVVSSYGVSKLLAEQEVWRGMAEGLAVAVAIPSIVLGSGPWQDNTMNFFRLGFQGNAFYPKGASGFVDVRDVARFLIELMNSDVINERFLVTGENTTYQDVMARIATHFGRKPPNIPIGKTVQRVYSWVDWVQHKLTGSTRVVTSDTVRTAGDHLEYDNSKSRHMLDFNYISLDQTLAETCRQYAEAAQDGFGVRTLPLVK